jgi:hypothetical protein
MGAFFDPLKVDIDRFIGYANGFIDIDGTLSSKKFELLSAFLKEILSNVDYYEESIQFNILSIGRIFKNSILSKDYNDEITDEVLIFLIRAAKEFAINSDTSLSVGTIGLLSFFKEQSELYSSKLNAQIDYAFNRMPFKIIRYYNDKSLVAINDNMLKNIEKILSEKIPEKKIEINSLRDSIDGYIEELKKLKQRFSFVSLNKAFYDLSSDKQISKNISLGILVFFGVLIIGIPIAEAIYNNHPASTDKLYDLVSMVLVESILIYFFRIILHKYNSLADQIVQLETKQAIIQFIESYVDYKKGKGLKNEDTEKFDEIIFSKISPNLKDIPDYPNIVYLVEGIMKAIKK